VQKVIKAFGWDEDEYLGNYTIKELLTTQVDIRSRKIKNLTKLTNGVIPEAKDVKHQYSLLEFAMSPQVKAQQVKLPSVVLDGDMPTIRTRYYSIVSDPHYECIQAKTDRTKWETKSCRVAFNVHQFLNPTTMLDQEGFATSFLASLIGVSPDKQPALQLQVHPSAKILRVPEQLLTTEDKVKIIMIAQGSGVTPFVSIIERIANMPEVAGRVEI